MRMLRVGQRFIQADAVVRVDLPPPKEAEPEEATVFLIGGSSFSTCHPVEVAMLRAVCALDAAGSRIAGMGRPPSPANRPTENEAGRQPGDRKAGGGLASGTAGES